MLCVHKGALSTFTKCNEKFNAMPEPFLSFFENILNFGIAGGQQNMRHKKHIRYTHRMCVIFVSNLLSAPY